MAWNTDPQFNALKENLQPNKGVIKIYCPECKELQLKIYPWASIKPFESVPNCKRCRSKQSRELRIKQMREIKKHRETLANNKASIVTKRKRKKIAH